MTMQANLLLEVFRAEPEVLEAIARLSPDMLEESLWQLENNGTKAARSCVLMYGHGPEWSPAGNLQPIR